MVVQTDGTATGMRKRGVFRGVLCGLLLAALLVGAGILLAYRSANDPLAAERAATALRHAQFWGTVWTIVGLVLVLVVVLGVCGGVVAGVRWANRRAGEIRPIDGQFPIQREHLLTWLRGPRLIVYYHDANKAVGPTTVYAAVGAGDQIQVKQIQVEQASPAQERITARAQAVQAMAALPRGLHSVGRGRQSMISLEEPSGPPIQFQYPSEVNLLSLMDVPSIERLVLGVTVDLETGRQEVIREAINKMVHLAVGGSSGWGKSVFLRSLAYQMALSEEAVHLVMIDLEGATFAPFARAERLLYPIADNERDARAVMSALVDELGRRKELYRVYPGVDSLHAYNARATEPLPPIVGLFDEATALLEDRDIESATKTLALRARKYGLWLILGGQDWKASSLDTAIRNQLSTRVQFAALSASQSRVLLQQAGAEKLDSPGRALAILPGRRMVELQSPFISHRRIAVDVSGNGPMQGMPQPSPAGADETSRRVWKLHQEGKSDTAIARKVFRYGTSFYIDKVREIIRRQQQSTAN